jgi:DNA-binding NarL/FixJ family response regulator
MTTRSPQVGNAAARTEMDVATSMPSDSSPLAQWPFVERRRTADRRAERRAGSLSVPDVCTAREQQILQLLMQGMTNKAIAQRLGIVEDTVKKHLQHIYDKLGVRRRTLLMIKSRGE